MCVCVLAFEIHRAGNYFFEGKKRMNTSFSAIQKYKSTKIISTIHDLWRSRSIHPFHFIYLRFLPSLNYLLFYKFNRLTVRKEKWRKKPSKNYCLSNIILKVNQWLLRRLHVKNIKKLIFGFSEIDFRKFIRRQFNRPFDIICQIHMFHMPSQFIYF